MTEPPPRRPFLNALSVLLRLDLSRQDVVKWVYFARQLLVVLLGAAATVAALSAYLSTWQAQDLMRESLESEARAIAGAAARAAFVPLSLDDRAGVDALVQSYRDVERIGLLRITDSRGRASALSRTPEPRRLVTAVAPVVPLEDLGGDWRRGKGGAVGLVEVGLRTDWIERRTRSVALANFAIGAGVALIVVLLGAVVVGTLVERTRELVGEARLAAEVQRVNRELEAFSYSVAHDLRAPLRSIDGFSRIMLENYGGTLDAEGKGYLERLRASSQRMGRLIDDLLGLSQVARGDVRRERCDLSALSREILDGLRRAQPGRDVESVVQDGLTADADPGLLRVALENLIGNAWKYTQRKPKAVIEIGAERTPDGPVFFVRDNGAGFDMAYAGKLFQPFSRLHSPGQFEGTGIGLATVHRVVTRHGGRIWGEAKVDQGATFRFTLGGVRL